MEKQSILGLGQKICKMSLEHLVEEKNKVRQRNTMTKARIIWAIMYIEWY